MERRRSVRRQRRYRQPWYKKCKEYVRQFIAFLFSNVGIIMLVVSLPLIPLPMNFTSGTLPGGLYHCGIFHLPGYREPPHPRDQESGLEEQVHLRAEAVQRVQEAERRGNVCYGNRLLNRVECLAFEVFNYHRILYDPSCSIGTAPRLLFAEMDLRDIVLIGSQNLAKTFKISKIVFFTFWQEEHTESSFF